MERVCRECGLDRIEPGWEIEGEPLCWAEEDLCSHCADQLAAAEARDAKRYRHLRDRPTRTVDIALGGVFAGLVPDNLILGGEDLDRAVDRALGGEETDVPTLEKRMAQCLAAIIDAPLLSGRDDMGGHRSPLDIRLGFFAPDLAERACALLEEAGE